MAYALRNEKGMFAAPKFRFVCTLEGWSLLQSEAVRAQMAPSQVHTLEQIVPLMARLVTHTDRRGRTTLGWIHPGAFQSTWKHEESWPLATDRPEDLAWPAIHALSAPALLKEWLALFEAFGVEVEGVPWKARAPLIPANRHTRVPDKPLVGAHALLERAKVWRFEAMAPPQGMDALSSARAIVVFAGPHHENKGYLGKNGWGALGASRLFLSVGAAQRTCSQLNLNDCVFAEVETRVVGRADVPLPPLGAGDLQSVLALRAGEALNQTLPEETPSPRPARARI